MQLFQHTSFRSSYVAIYRNRGVCHVPPPPRNAYEQMTLKMWDAQLDTRPYLRCLGTSALAITSRRKQLHGHGSWQQEYVQFLYSPWSEITLLVNYKLFIWKVYHMFLESQSCPHVLVLSGMNLYWHALCLPEKIIVSFLPSMIVCIKHDLVINVVVFLFDFGQC